MTDGLDLRPRHRDAVRALLARHLPEVEVWAYGSRTDGRSHGGSDLDLVLRAPGLTPISRKKLARLKEAFRDSTIPFLVEAHDWALLPQAFRSQIERKHVVLIEAPATAGHPKT